MAASSPAKVDQCNNNPRCDGFPCNHVIEAHPPTKDCPDPECMVCGARDCKFHDETHYWHGGCASCYADSLRQAEKERTTAAHAPDKANQKNG